LTIGRWAMIGMGSLVTKSVPDFHLAIGHPARSVGCVCRCGQLLMRFEDNRKVSTTCTACGLQYTIENQVVTELETNDFIAE
jgi:serine acetyltransferase